MIDVDYVRRLARYNRWQNENLYGAADTLSDAERRRERGAFFGSIHKTLSHLVWGDRAWMSRLAGWPMPPGGIPASTTLVGDWTEMTRERAEIDAGIVAWAEALEPAGLAGSFTYYSQAMGREMTGPRWLLVTHVFNHQTHHRGQVHCMLTQAGAWPGDTDLSFMPE
jgi:uncharacterized damage-inducible protein DinB